MCLYCNNNKNEAQFYSICISCNEGINGACKECFQLWANKHPIRPKYTSVNKWKYGTHLIDNFTHEGFNQRVNRYNSIIL